MTTAEMLKEIINRQNQQTKPPEDETVEYLKNIFGMNKKQGDK